MEKHIEVGVDQFTMVLQPTNKNFNFDDWRSIIAPRIIEEFIHKSKMTQLFNGFDKADVRIPDGYNIGYSFNNSPFYFCIAYHEAFYKMGIIVKFSAYSWEEYRKRYELMFNTSIHIHTFFRLIESDMYDYRLSRIDPCVDFFNCNINIAQLKRSLEAGRTEIRYGKY
ncbi:hypothetical protein IGK38_000069 [Enterococcus pernyi]